jgi:hypothetical protein
VKKIISFALVLIVLLSFTYNVSATENGLATVMVVEDNATAEQEVTEWYFRVNNNRIEKRLWSITFGRWLTDWMPILPAI